MTICTHCGNPTKSSINLYCSLQCQNDYQFEQYILRWKRGLESGGRGVNTKNISAHLRRYLFNKFGSACSLCGWCEINKTTSRTPLEIDHIDGNSENNQENNLRILCPNCHALSSNFRNLNHGNGRAWRKQKYIKEK